MKSDLRRIEATLQHLEISTADYPKPAATRKVNAPPRKNRSYSFEISGAAQQRHHSVQQLTNSPEQTSSEVKLISAPSNLQHEPAQQSAYTEPMLPKFNSSTSAADSSSNSASRINLSPDYTDAAACQAELQQIVRQVKDLYMEGPIVDGWLESHQCTPEPRNVTQCDEVEHQIDYVTYSFEQGISCESPHAAYRLCGFDAAGQKWSRPCPLAQLPSVSIAIARYRHLQQLLKRKHYFETCLSQIQP